MDVQKIRQDFPVLKNQPKLTYFDNACMTLRPQSVIDEIRRYYEEYPVCAGRSHYRLAEKLTQDIERARREVAGFIGAQKKEEIIFTKNTTEAINMVAYGLGLKKGDVVLGTDKEHNSNLTPWLRLIKERGITYKALPSCKDNSFDLERYKEMVRGVRLVAMVMTSNLDGATIPVKEVIEIAHKEGALVLLDGAQAVGHHEVNVKKLDVDFLAFSGHKMCGPSGTGVLYGKRKLLEKLNPLLLGGGAILDSKYDRYELLSLPERFEAGLQNYAGILGLGSAVRYLKQIGFKNIAEQELKLNKLITTNLKDIEDIKIIGPEDPRDRSGVVAFHCTKHKDKSVEIAVTLDQMSNIATRSGQFCVHSWFNARSIEGALRASFYFYNTEEEAKKFVETLKKIVSIYK